MTRNLGLSYLWAISWMAIIFFFSSLATLPSASVIWWDYVLKKSAHLGEYAILFWLWYRALIRDTRFRSGAVAICFLIVILYAISDEWHQSWTPGRHPKLADVLIDTLGAFIMYLKVEKFV